MATEHEEECFPPLEFILSTIQHEKSDNVDETTTVVAEQSGDGDFTNDRSGVQCLHCLRRVNSLICGRCVIEKGEKFVRIC